MPAYFYSYRRQYKGVLDWSTSTTLEFQTSYVPGTLASLDLLLIKITSRQDRDWCVSGVTRNKLMHAH